MSIVTFNKKKLLNELKSNEKEVIEAIRNMGLSVEEINDDEISIEVLPNRPDLLSFQGLCRALKAFLKIEYKSEYKCFDSEYKVIVDKNVSKVRPYTACAIVKNVSFDDENIRSIIQLQEKLHLTYGRKRKRMAIGIYPMEKIKFPIYYKADIPEKIRFVPLGSKEEMNGKEILKYHPTGKEYAHLLEGKDLFPYFIDSNNNILSMPPIINSELTGKITTETKDVFIECSGFSLDVLEKGLNIIVTSLIDMGGKAYSIEVIYPNFKIKTPDLNYEKMKIDFEYITRYLGKRLSRKEIEEALRKMNLILKDSYVLIPPYRTDIIHPIDIVEDVAIGHGYDNFTLERSNFYTIGEEDKIERLKRKIREILIGYELIEVKNLHLTSEMYEKEKMKINEKLIKLKNSVNEEYNSLRPSLFSSLLRTLEINKHNEYPQNIFEIGIVFKLDGNTIIEQEHLGVALCNLKSDYTRIRQILEGLIRELDLNVSFEEKEYDFLIKGRSAKVLINNKESGYIGEVHPEILENIGLEMPVSIFEINIENLLTKE